MKKTDRQWLVSLVIGVLLAGCLILTLGNRTRSSRAIVNVNEYVAIASEVGNGKTTGYDLRDVATCAAGHIQGFLCTRVEVAGVPRSLAAIAEQIDTLYGTSQTIVLMDEDGSDAAVLASLLLEKGFAHVVYYENGYDAFLLAYKAYYGTDCVQEKGECNC